MNVLNTVSCSLYKVEVTRYTIPVSSNVDCEGGEPYAEIILKKVFGEWCINLISWNRKESVSLSEFEWSSMVNHIPYVDTYLSELAVEEDSILKDIYKWIRGSHDEIEIPWWFGRKASMYARLRAELQMFERHP